MSGVIRRNPRYLTANLHASHFPRRNLSREIIGNNFASSRDPLSRNFARSDPGPSQLYMTPVSEAPGGTLRGEFTDLRQVFVYET